MGASCSSSDDHVASSTKARLAAANAASEAHWRIIAAQIDAPLEAQKPPLHLRPTHKPHAEQHQVDHSDLADFHTLSFPNPLMPVPAATEASPVDVRKASASSAASVDSPPIKRFETGRPPSLATSPDSFDPTRRPRRTKASRRPRVQKDVSPREAGDLTWAASANSLKHFTARDDRQPPTASSSFSTKGDESRGGVSSLPRKDGVASSSRNSNATSQSPSISQSRLLRSDMLDSFEGSSINGRAGGVGATVDVGAADVTDDDDRDEDLRDALDENCVAAADELRHREVPVPLVDSATMGSSPSQPATTAAQWP